MGLDATVADGWRLAVVVIADCCCCVNDDVLANWWGGLIEAPPAGDNDNEDDEWHDGTDPGLLFWLLLFVAKTELLLLGDIDVEWLLLLEDPP